MPIFPVKGSNLKKKSDEKDDSFISGSGSSTNDSFSAFNSLNENSSIKDVINSSKAGISVIGECFTVLPGWIWALVSIGLIVAIVLRILGR